MRYALLTACGVAAALLLAPSPGSALESCYQICTPSTPCSTPCVDPYRPWLGPLACGAGFSCARRSDNEGVFVSEFNFNNDQAACKTSSSLQENRVPAVQPGR